MNAKMKVMKWTMQASVLAGVLLGLLGSAAPGFAMQSLSDDEMSKVQGADRENGKKCGSRICTEGSTEACGFRADIGRCFKQEQNAVISCLTEGASANDFCDKKYTGETLGPNGSLGTIHAVGCCVTVYVSTITGNCNDADACSAESEERANGAFCNYAPACEGSNTTMTPTGYGFDPSNNNAPCGSPNGPCDGKVHTFSGDPGVPT